MASSGSGGNAGSSHWVAIAIALITAIGVVIAAIVGGPQVIVVLRDQGQATGVALLQPTIESLKDQATPTNMPVVTAVTAVTVIAPPPVTAVTAVTVVTAIVPTSIPPPTPNPSILFSDSFENTIDPVLGMMGEHYTSANGKLVVGGDGSVQSGIVGNGDWRNYRVKIDGIAIKYNKASDFTIGLHVQDKDNYIAIYCYQNFGSSPYRHCQAYEVINGEMTSIPGTEYTHESKEPLLIGVEGNVYRYSISASDAGIRFTNNQFINGGILLKATSPDADSVIEFGSVDVVTLP